MIKFNDDNVFTGYIKQMLHSFNLPNVRVYKKGSFLYDGELFIRDNYIQIYNEDSKTFSNIIPFSYNKPLLNYTKNLKIENILYDSHTHEYLGEYLRFIRDFHNLDLMSMYNCFSDNIISSIKLNFGEKKDKVFESDTTNYKIYSVPVKFGKKYTIAISCIQPIELICALYSKSVIEDKSDKLVTPITTTLNNLTYKKVNLSDFKNPFIYDCLLNDQFKNKFLYDHEDYLRLFIKIPNNNRSSIVILEGEYLNTNKKYPNNQLNGKWQHATTVVNYDKSYSVEGDLEPTIINESGEDKEYSYYDVPLEYITQVNKNKDIIKDNDELYKVKLTTSLQLLELNSTISYGFADRLIEYLTKNTVTKSEEISDNIERMQKQLVRRKRESYNEEDEMYYKKGLSSYKKDGIWEEKYRNVLYDIASQEGLIDDKFDVLGYMDKDIESKLGNDINIYEKE